MSITFSEELIKVLDYLFSKFGIAIDWTSNNVFPYLQTLAEKLVRFEINTSIMWLSFGGLLLAVGIFLIVKDVVKWNEGAGTVLGGMLVIVGLVVCGCQIYDIIKCTSFPELYVIEYITPLLQK